MIPFELADRAVELRGNLVTREFESLETFAAHLVLMERAWRHEKKLALNEACKLIKSDARKQIGEYQAAVGPFPAWEPLAESTEDQKSRMGYEPDKPLLAEGDLRNSFRSNLVNEHEAVVGSTDPVMDFHEFGTVKMPPRPVLGPALYKNRERIEKLLGVAIIDAILVGQRMGVRLIGGENAMLEEG